MLPNARHTRLVPNSSANGSPVPIGARIEARLNELGKNPSWLADMVGVSRSTVTRILNGERNPTPDTLNELAPVLGVELAQLVAGTDAADRVREAQNLVSRRDYEDAVKQIIEFERQASTLKAQLRELTDRDRKSEERVGQLAKELNEARRVCSVRELERDQARTEAARFEHQANRYLEGLGQAVSDVAQLRAKVRELSEQVQAGHRTGRVGAILAGVAAAVSVASYLGDESSSDVAVRKTKSVRRRTKRTKK